jgi:hypothetical protein
MFTSDLSTTTKQVPEGGQQKDFPAETKPTEGSIPQSVGNNEKLPQWPTSERLPHKERHSAHKSEFLQTLDNQLTKIQQDDDRSKKSLSSDNNEMKLLSRNGSLGKSGGSIRILEQELSELLKAPTPTAPSSEGQGKFVFSEGIFPHLL